mgnify:FL=1
MALAGDASPAVIGRSAHKRSSAKDGAHLATKAGDKLLRANKPVVPVCDETREKAASERATWAEKVFAVAAQTVATYEGRQQEHSR